MKRLRRVKWIVFFFLVSAEDMQRRRRKRESRKRDSGGRTSRTQRQNNAVHHLASPAPDMGGRSMFKRNHQGGGFGGAGRGMFAGAGRGGGDDSTVQLQKLATRMTTLEARMERSQVKNRLTRMTTLEARMVSSFFSSCEDHPPSVCPPPR